MAEVFAGLDPSPARFARWAAGPDLPDDPSPEQVEAWIELAGLASDGGLYVPERIPRLEPEAWRSLRGRPYHEDYFRRLRASAALSSLSGHPSTSEITRPIVISCQLASSSRGRRLRR